MSIIIKVTKTNSKISFYSLHIMIKTFIVLSLEQRTYCETGKDRLLH